MQEIRKVVVIVSPSMLYSDVVNRHAARIDALGLTGYGDDHTAALDKVKNMFASWVSGHREMGDLVQWLDKSELKWHWLDEYHGNYEDVSVTEKPNARRVKSRLPNVTGKLENLEIAA